MKRAAQGAFWSLPIAFALAQGIGGHPLLAQLAAGAFVLCALVRQTVARAILRAAIWAGAVLITVTGDVRALPPLALRIGHLLWHLHFTALTQSESTLLFVTLVPLLIVAFERGTGLGLRVAQGIAGFVVLSALAHLSVSVTSATLAFAAFFFPVRYFDLRGDGGSGRIGPALSAIAFLAACSLVLATNAPILAVFSRGGHGGLAVQGYLTSPQQLDVAPQESSAPYFFAYVSQPVYWTTFVGERYTGQGWKIGGKWRRMKPLELTGNVPSDVTVRRERLRLYRSMPTDPVGGALLTVLSPYESWRYRSASDAYRAKGSRITVLAARPQPGGGLDGPGALPPTGADLFVPPGVDSDLLRTIAKVAVHGAGQGTMAKAEAIVAYLHANERYTLQVPSDQGLDFVYDFLVVHHAGDCNGFSSAFAILARMNGIPTRWVSGFLPGTQESGGYLVTAKDAHSWDEIYVRGKGWIEIDPTPGFAVPTPPPPVSGQSTQDTTKAALRHARLAEKQLLGSVQTGSGAKSHPFPWGAVGLGVLAILAGFALYVRQTLPLWSVRGISRLLRDPWLPGETVRHWLRGRAPELQSYLEWRLYRPQAPCPASLPDARRALREMYLPSGRRRGEGTEPPASGGPAPRHSAAQ